MEKTAPPVDFVTLDGKTRLWNWECPCFFDCDGNPSDGYATEQEALTAAVEHIESGPLSRWHGVALAKARIAALDAAAGNGAR